MLLFKHPSGEISRGDRYAWYNARVPEAQDPRARLRPREVLEKLTDGEVAMLFRRSMPVHTERPSYIVS
jgi:hypothetical protein